MTDPLRSDRPVPGADIPERDRDARVEDLLLAGLDHYFAGQYDLAISVWSRVLFLNHGHARARAYIERARSAIAERQREGDELAHTGAEALARGDATTARRLLASALEHGVASDEALSLLDWLNRLQSASGTPGSSAIRLGSSSPAVIESTITTVDRRPSRLRWVAAGLAAGLAVAGVSGWLWFQEAFGWQTRAAAAPAPAGVEEREPLPVPAASEASLSRARTLQAKGRLHEALSSLESVQHGDPSWQEAQTLRAVIQGQLLAGEGMPLPRQEAGAAEPIARPGAVERMPHQ